MKFIANDMELERILPETGICYFQRFVGPNMTLINAQLFLWDWYPLLSITHTYVCENWKPFD